MEYRQVAPERRHHPDAFIRVAETGVDVQPIRNRRMLSWNVAANRVYRSFSVVACACHDANGLRRCVSPGTATSSPPRHWESFPGS